MTKGVSVYEKNRRINLRILSDGLSSFFHEFRFPANAFFSLTNMDGGEDASACQMESDFHQNMEIFRKDACDKNSPYPVKKLWGGIPVHYRRRSAFYFPCTSQMIFKSCMPAYIYV
ncbi:MAG: hypothetical protein JXL67_00885 [Calditrichaeota bacterium]|nr:hypothetical protein [Calditrichota bacterium]